MLPFALLQRFSSRDGEAVIVSRWLCRECLAEITAGFAHHPGIFPAEPAEQLQDLGMKVSPAKLPAMSQAGEEACRLYDGERVSSSYTAVFPKST